jgi:predicted transposase YbfD/YdcC
MFVKANQGGLLALLELHLASPLAARVPRQTAEVREVGHGRIERRRLTSSPVLAGRGVWPGLSQIFRLERERRQKKSGKRQVEVVYGVTSLPVQQAGPGVLLALARGHWGIENRLHYVRDVTFREDGCQARCGSVPQVLAALRNTAIGLLRQAGWQNIAAATRYYAAQPWAALALLGVAPDN